MCDAVARWRWLTALGLALGVCVSNGFARFAYGLILPAMKADLDWTYAQAGWINTANAIGYLAGAMLTLAVIKHVHPATLFIVGMVGTSVSLVLSGLTDSFFWLSVWRIVSGVTGAPVFIAGGILVANLFADPQRTAFAVALYFGGGGLGMILSGAVLPEAFAAFGSEAWPFAWVCLGLASGAMTIGAVWAAHQAKGLEGPAATPRTGVAVTLPVREMLPALVGYGFFATGYIVYITFLAAWMSNVDATPGMVSVTWIVIGLGIIFSPFAWRAILGRFRNGVPLALAIGVTALGTFLPILLSGWIAIIASAALFGLAVFIAPSAITTFSRYNLPLELHGRAVALFTTVFAACQMIGPVAAGAVGDATGSIEGGIFAAGIVLAVGAFIAFWQRSIPCTA